MPTDADWGRMYAGPTGGDAGLVMPFRSYYSREFFEPSPWYDMTIGLIYRNSGASSDTSAIVAERQSESTMANLFHFGISQPEEDGTITVANNKRFIGLRGYIGGVTQINPTPTFTLGQLSMTYVRDAAYAINGSPIAIPVKQGSGATPYAMIGIRFIHNPTNNTLYMKYAHNDNVVVSTEDSNVTTIQAFMAGISNDTSVADAAFPGVISMRDYSSYFIYWPYLTNKLMLHCVSAIRNA